MVNQIHARQVIGIRLTTLIRHESEKNAESWMTGRDLICFTREFFVVPPFRLMIQTFRAEFFLSLVDHCRIFRSSFRNICTTSSFPVVLVLPTLMSAKPVEISDRGVFTGTVLASVIYNGKS